MSDLFAEATVTLVPDLTGFATRLQAELKETIGRIETGPRAPKIRVAPTLTRDFVGNLRNQVNAAITRAQRGVKPIQVTAVLTDVSSAAIAREVRTRTQQVSVGGIQRAGSTRQRVATETDRAAKSTAELTREERLLSSAYARGVPILGTTASETASLNKERAAGAAAIRNTTQFLEQQTVAQIAFARAQQAAAEAQLHVAGSSQQARAFRLAESRAVEAVTLANKELEQPLLRSVQAFRDQLRTIPEASAALGEHSRAAAATARSHSQLRRGVFATGLSFLGIRGATLAASASFLAGAAAIAIFAKALDNATRFADQLNVFRATTGATAEQLEQVRDTARALGADLSLPGVTAADAAEAMTELAKAGLDVQNSLAGARGVLQLATAAAIDNAQAVELVANALNAFSLQGEDATRVADTFANAANAAQGSIVDIGIAFQQSAAAGRQVGLTFEDTTAFLTTLARAGLRGSDAGTSLRTALLRLIRPSKDAAARLEELGIQTRDAAGNLRPDVFIQIAEATRELSPAARDAAIALIGGQDAFRAISILGRQSIREFIRLRRELRDQGTAAELASARMQGLRGSLEGLSNLLSTVGIRIGNALTPSLQGAVDGLAAFTQGMSQSEAVANILGGALEAVTVSTRVFAEILQDVGTVAIPAASGLASVANSLGVANIIAAVAAYKLLPPLFLRIRATAAVASTAIALMSLAGINPLRAAVTAIASSFNLWAVGIAAAAAGILFLITRENEAERATRKFADATNALVDAHQRLNQAVRQNRSQSTGENQAQLDLLEAQQRAGAARATLGTTPRGTQERIRAELELAVALDDVAAAQQRVSDATREAEEARIILLNAQRRDNQARLEEIRSIEAVTKAIEDQVFTATRGGRRGRGESAGAAAARIQETQARAFVQQLDKQIAKLRESDDIESLVQANRLERLRNITAAVQRLPSEKAIEIAVNTGNADKALRLLIQEFGITGKDAIAALRFALEGEGARQITQAMTILVEGIEAQFAPTWKDAGRRMGFEHGRGIAEGIAQSQPEVTAATAGIVTRRVNQGLGLERQGVALEISGAGAEARLANARAQEQNARDILARLQARGASEEAITRAQNRVLEKMNARIAIEEEIAAAQEEIADAQKKAADAADEAALGRLERRRGRAQDRIADAQQTKGVSDDLRATIAFRNLIRHQINRIRDVIKDRAAQIVAIRALQAIERDLNRDIAQLQKDRRQEQKDRRQAIADRIAESIQLDIEFAQTTENRRAEIRAREREIARLRKLQADTKKGTVEYRRYRNAIAEQQRAIDELKKQQKERNDSFRALTFEFLQAQQGFATNLLGNLIPGGATSGLVGALSFTPPIPAGPGVTAAAGGRALFPEGPPRVGGGVAADARADGAMANARNAGPTRGQASTQVELLRQIVNLLSGQERSSRNPHARRQHAIDISVSSYEHGVG